MNKYLVIALDISTTSTGYALWESQSGCIQAMYTIKPMQGQTMYTAVTAVLNTDLMNAYRLGYATTVVVENYTSTLVNNDRSGVANHIIALKNSIVNYIITTRLARLAAALPWSWRKVYGLPTKVIGETPKWSRVAKVLGHDILKQNSVNHLNKMISEGHVRVPNNKIGNINDDEAEAVLILESFLITKNYNQDSDYYNAHTITAADVMQQLDELK